jgi:large subunit ribosomal protein L35Ae
VKGAFLGFCRGQRKQSQNKHLLSIDGVKSTADSAFYMGKRVAYIYRAKAVVKGTHYRVIWGRIARPHGTNGVVRAYFRSNLPPRAMGASVRVMLYPSRV